MCRRIAVIICWSLLSLFVGHSAPAQSIASLPGAEWLGRSPGQAYYQGLELYRDGNLPTAIEALQTALSGCLRDTNGFWIDAIPVHAMLGECYYQSGDLRQAVTHIESALSLLSRNRNWLGRFDWSSVTPGRTQTADERSGWITDNQVSVMQVPDWLMLAAIDPKLARSAETRPLLTIAGRAQLDVVEIHRAAAVAAYRRRLILGEIAAQTSRIDPTRRTDDPLPSSLPQLVSVAVDRCLELSCGQSPMVEDLEALAALEQAVHPLTPVLLLAAARVAIEQERFDQASSLAERAGEAASLLGQPEFVAEALLIAVGSRESGSNESAVNYPAVAVHYLRRGRVATAGALLAASEAALQQHESKTAGELLRQAGAMLQRSSVHLPRLAAHGDYLTACLAAQQGATLGGPHPSEADDALQRLQRFADGSQANPPSPGAPRIFQMNLALARSRQRDADPQQSEILLERVARDPPTWQWKADPVDAVGFHIANRTPAIAARLHLAVEHDLTTDLVALADGLLRHRFLVQLPLGGRLQQVRWIGSDLPEPSLGPAAKLRETSSDDLRRQLSELAKRAPPVAPDVEADRSNDAIATQLALRRSALPQIVPPPLTEAISHASLDEKCGILIFVDCGERFLGLLVRREQTRSWSLPPSRTLHAEVLAVLRTLGVPDVTAGSRLSGSDAWPGEVAKITRRLIPDEHHTGVLELRQLIIVPDGVLWYLPLELLALQGDSDAVGLTQLGQRVAIRYCATPGLALLPSQPISEPREFVAAPEQPAPLQQWLLRPASAPHRVIIPTLSTAAADTPLGNGGELFTTLASLRCSGVQEVLVSRWQVGGESTHDLMSELLQELPFTALRPAWQRSVELLRRRLLDPQTEPLLIGKDAQLEQIQGEHPLFWSGYLLDAPFAQ